MKKKNQIIPIQPKQNLPLIDCHCHFPLHTPPKQMSESYEEQYINFFNDNGQYLISSVEWEEYKYLKKFIENHKKIKLSLGIGPQTVTYSNPEKFEKIFPEFINFLSNNLDSYNVIGEIGLDFHHAKTYKKRVKQIEIFKKIIQKTKNLKKPYSFHVRNPSSNDFDPNSLKPEFNEKDIVNKIILEVMDNENINPNNVMWHCFSGPSEWGQILSDKGYYLSIPSSAYGFKKWRRNIKGIDLTKILTETDAAWQHPYSIGEFNIPNNVKYALAAIAYELNLEQEKIADQVLKNAKIFFDLT